MLYLPLRTNSGQGGCFRAGHLFYFYLTATYCFRKCLYRGGQIEIYGISRPNTFWSILIGKGFNEIYGEEWVVNFGLYIESNSNLFKEIARFLSMGIPSD